MSLLKILPLFRDRRYVYIVFFILLCIGLIQAGSYFIASYVNEHWENISTERTRKSVDRVLSTFNDYQIETLSFAERVAADDELRKSLSKYLGGGKEELSNLFSTIERRNAYNAYTIEIYNRFADCIAWSGRRVPTPDSVIQKGLTGRRLSIVSQGFIYSYLSVLVPIQLTPNTVNAVVVVSRTLEVNYPLHNRFLRSTGLASQLSKWMNTKVEFDFSPMATESKDGRIVSAVITGINGSKIGMLYIMKPGRSVAVQEIKDTTMKITVFLIVVLSLVICYGLRKLYWDQSALSFKRFFVLTINLWLVRYLWLFIGFPSRLSDADIFQPTYFASTFGFGIAKNTGEVLLSVLFLLINCIYLLSVTVNYIKQQGSAQRTTSKLRTFLGLVLTLLFALLFSLLLRGYGATMRSVVFDSTLKYNDPTSVLPSPMLALMELNLLLLTISLILCSIAILLLAYRAIELFRISFDLKWIHSWSGAKGAIILVFVIIGFMSNAAFNSPIPQMYQLVFTIVLAVAGIMVFRKIVHGQSFGVIKTSAIVLLLSIVIIYPLLDDKVREYQREVVQVAASELVQPVDGWMTFILNETMSQISTDENLIAELQEENNERLPALAFQVWATSRLSHEGYNSAVIIMDTTNHVLSRFSVGIPDRDITQFLASLQPLRASQAFITSLTESRGRKKYVGFMPILNEEGKALGGVWILLPARESVLSKALAPEILRSYRSEGANGEFENIIISEFINGELSSSTADDFPRGYRMPDEVYVMLRERKSGATTWIKETIEGDSYSSYYIVAESVNGKERMLALSIKELDIRWHIFNFSKMGLFYLVVSVLCLLIYFVYRLSKGGHYRLTFRDKLLIAFLVVSVIPTLLVWSYVRDFSLESIRDTLRQRLSEDLMIVKESLSRWFSEDISSNTLNTVVTNDFCKGIATETGKDFNVYIGSDIIASSRPEVYQTELLDRRLSNQAYLNIVLLGKRFYAENESIGQFPYLVGYEPLLNSRGEIVGIISLPTLYRQTQIEQDMAKTSAFIFGGYAIVLVLIVGLGTFFANRISSPIKRLTDATRRVSSGELDVEVQAQSKDELGTLVDSFNRMIRDVKKSRKELALAERELAWREMAKQVAHEIKNPLTPMKLLAQHLQQAYRDKAKNFSEIFETATQTLIEQIDALGRIASEFSRFAKMPQRQYERCSVNELLLDTVHLFEQSETTEKKEVDFELNFSDNIPEILADKEELRRVFINIVRNGIQAIHTAVSDQATSRKGKVHIQTTLENGSVRITISDNGCGIPDEIKDRLFEPNFSTKTDGMGLGLAISKKIIDDLNGRIEIASQVGKGTEVKIVLPIGSV